jgi:hypothetical protein
MSLLLLEVYRHYFAVLPDKVDDSWLAKAVTDPDGNIILMLGTLRTENSIDSYLKVFKLACKSNNKARVRVFFGSNFLGCNQGYLQGARCPLYDAVSMGNVGSVEELLDIGAHPDGVPTSSVSFRPLGAAVASEDLEMVRLFLEYGANPKFVMKWRNKNRGFRNSRDRIWSLIDEYVRKPVGDCNKMEYRIVTDGEALQVGWCGRWVTHAITGVFVGRQRLSMNVSSDVEGRIVYLDGKIQEI